MPEDHLDPAQQKPVEEWERIYCEVLKRDITNLKFSDMLSYCSSSVYIALHELGNVRFIAHHAETRLPQHQTHRDIWHAQLLVKRIVQMKTELEHMLPWIEDWAESQVAMLGRGSQTTTHLDTPA